MSAQMIVQSSASGGSRIVPPADLPVQDVYKNLVSTREISLGTAGRILNAAYFSSAATPFAIAFDVVSKSGTGTDPIVSLGLNASDANLASEITLTGLSDSGAAGSSYIWPLSGLVPKIPAGTPVNLNVATAAGFTCTVQVRVIGTAPAA